MLMKRIFFVSCPLNQSNTSQVTNLLLLTFVAFYFFYCSHFCHLYVINLKNQQIHLNGSTYLVLYEGDFEYAGLFELVGFEAANVVVMSGVEPFEQGVQGDLQLSGYGNGPFDGASLRVALGEQRLHERMVAAVDGPRDFSGQEVSVLLDETSYVVENAAGVVSYS